MRNERGITLVELIAVLAIVGIIMTLIVSVLINGKNASNRIMTNQQLQQEANYIGETIRNEYLKNENGTFSIAIDNPSKTLKIGSNQISVNYCLTFNLEVKCDEDKINTINIDRNKDETLKFKISKDKLFIEVNTTLSKLH